MLNRALLLLIPGIAVALPSAAASPNWLQIVSGTDPGPVVFIDTNSIELRAGRLSAWTLYNYMEPQKTDGQRAYLSGVGLKVFDCTSERVGTISFSFYSENSGQGDVVWSASREPDEVPLRYSAPGSLGDKVLSTVCQLAAKTAQLPPTPKPASTPPRGR
jgi:hypothetical protein